MNRIPKTLSLLAATALVIAAANTALAQKTKTVTKGKPRAAGKAAATGKTTGKTSSSAQTGAAAQAATTQAATTQAAATPSTNNQTKSTAGSRLPKINNRHITRGEIHGLTGQAAGYHLRPGGVDHPNARMTKLVDPTSANSNGVYTGMVEVQDKNGNWIPKGAPSSFFPDNWDLQRVKQEIHGAYQNSKNSKPTPGMPSNYFRGTSPSGIDISGYTSPKGDKINSAYPHYVP